MKMENKIWIVCKKKGWKIMLRKLNNSKISLYYFDGELDLKQ